MRKQIITAAVTAVLATSGLAMAQMQSDNDRPMQRQGQNDAQRTDRMQNDQGAMQDKMGDQDNMRDKVSDKQMSPQQVKQMEKDFVSWSANVNLFEIEAAKLAQKSDNAQVKQLAQKIQSDHEQAQTQLKQAAKSAGYDVPSSIDNDVLKSELSALKDAQGDSAKFNNAYIFGNVADHTGAVLWTACAVEKCQNPQLKRYAQQTLPVLQQHKQRAQALAYNMIGGTTGDRLQSDARTASGQLGRTEGMDRDTDRDTDHDQNGNMRDNDQDRMHGDRDSQGEKGELKFDDYSNDETQPNNNGTTPNRTTPKRTTPSNDRSSQ